MKRRGGSCRARSSCESASPRAAGSAAGRATRRRCSWGSIGCSNSKLGRDRLISLACELGSDVAFLVEAVLGRGSALVTGTGEAIEASQLRKPLHLTLVIPPFGCPTGAVYRALDHRGESAPLDEARVRRLMAATAGGASSFNDLEAPAMTSSRGWASCWTTLRTVLDGRAARDGLGQRLLRAREKRAATGRARGQGATSWASPRWGRARGGEGVG